MHSFALLLIGCVAVALAVPLDDEAIEEFKKEKATLSKNCPRNTEWAECGNLCPKSCENFDKVSACFSLRCGAPQCRCKDGHVFLVAAEQHKGCVRRETCLQLRKTAAAAESTPKPSGGHH